MMQKIAKRWKMPSVIPPFVSKVLAHFLPFFQWIFGFSKVPEVSSWMICTVAAADNVQAVMHAPPVFEVRDEGFAVVPDVHLRKIIAIFWSFMGPIYWYFCAFSNPSNMDPLSLRIPATLALLRSRNPHGTPGETGRVQSCAASFFNQHGVLMSSRGASFCTVDLWHWPLYGTTTTLSILALILFSIYGSCCCYYRITFLTIQKYIFKKTWFFWSKNDCLRNQCTSRSARRGPRRPRRAIAMPLAAYADRATELHSLHEIFYPFFFLATLPV